MKKILFTITFIVSLCTSASATSLEIDSIEMVNLGEIEVYSSKETNLHNKPVSSTLLTGEKLDQLQVTSVKEMGVRVPNFYIPDYGSSMSSTPYVRGVGARSSGQSIALYLDNVPYFEKTAFDFELYDVARMEVFRGPQGTLYGRNSIGGIMNIYTLSPLTYQGLRASFSAGNYGLLHGKATYYTKLNSKLGLSFGGYYKQHNGFYRNDFTGKQVDAEKSGGARAKLAWNPTNNFKFEYISDFDFINQGAFPYGLYTDSTKTTANPNFNDESSYKRKTLNNSISTKHFYQDLIFSVSLAHQYFEDNMNIDQDFSPKSIFTLQQNQKQHVLNMEAVVKSVDSGNYKWLVGVNGFGQWLDITAPVSFREDGVKGFLQPMFPPMMTIKNETYDIPGSYDTRRSGGALFHQSTIDNLLTKGLSMTLGMRLDIDNIKLDYNTSSFMDLEMRRGPMVIPIHAADTLQGSMKTTFAEFLPRLALKYEWNTSNFVYASVSRGYKTGGFNIQMISDLMTEKLKNSSRPGGAEIDVKSSTIYQPERSWNYEVGVHNMFFDSKLQTNLTLFYMDITGLQLTEFIASGAGRMLTNAGTSTSKGVELSADLKLTNELNLGLNYGFANATFKHFTQIEKVNGADTEVDYSGKIVPYAPQQTVNGYLNYVKTFDNSFISQLYGNVSYNGIGKIFWNEANTMQQNFYSLIDAKLGVKKNAVGIEIWGKNLLNTSYNAFYFRSFGNKFFQQGKPMQFGARVTVDL